MSTSVTVKVHREDGQFWAKIEQYPGCFASGFTEAELEDSLVEGLSLYLSTPGHEVQATLSPVRGERPAGFVEFVERRAIQLSPA